MSEHKFSQQPILSQAANPPKFTPYFPLAKGTFFLFNQRNTF